MNYIDDSGLRRLSENDRMKLLREEESALGLWSEYHYDPSSDLPTIPAAPASAYGKSPNKASAEADDDQECGSVEGLDGAVLA